MGTQPIRRALRVRFNQSAIAGPMYMETKGNVYSYEVGFLIVK